MKSAKLERCARGLGLRAAMALAPAPLLVAGLVGLTPSVSQAAEYEQASCRVHSVLASPEGDGTIPTELAFLAAELGSPAFAAFKSFKLLGTARFELEKGKLVTGKLASGHGIALSLRGANDAQVKLHVKLGSAGGKSLVDTDYAIKPNGFVLFAAAHERGSVIFAVQCHGK